MDENIREYNIYKGIDLIMSQLRMCNAFVQQHKPWELRKQEHQADWLNNILAITLETLRITCILLQPVTPRLTDKALNRLGIANSRRNFVHATDLFCEPKHDLGENSGPLLKKVS